MKATLFVMAASAMCLAAPAQARTPVFLEIDGIKGETEKKRPKPQSAPAQQPQQGIAAPGTSQRGGVNVAVGDVTGDGRADTALLLPAVQKVRATDSEGTSVPATANTSPTPPPSKPSRRRGQPILSDHTNHSEGEANGAPDVINQGGKGSAGLLLPAVQKSGSNPNTSDPVPVTSSQGPYKTRRTAPSQPQGLLLPARQRIPSSVTTGQQGERAGGASPARRGIVTPRKAGDRDY